MAMSKKTGTLIIKWCRLFANKPSLNEKSAQKLGLDYIKFPLVGKFQALVAPVNRLLKNGCFFVAASFHGFDFQYTV
jgi:hypothetical protein